jgi:hypothetical protein
VSAAPAASIDWASRRGRCVIVEGYIEGGGKTKPHLLDAAGSIGVVLDDPKSDDAWDRLRHGARARVRGFVAERADLPVFIEEPGGPVMQGIPVPPGTDLEKARRRWVIERATAEVLRTAEQVQADLMKQVGRDVSLDGVVWSLNGEFWFRHDGVDVHVEGADAIPGWTSLHGSPRTLHGRLDRRPMPRIDQITLKADRDRADAFVLQVRAVTPHPVWPVVECGS